MEPGCAPWRAPLPTTASPHRPYSTSDKDNHKHKPRAPRARIPPKRSMASRVGFWAGCGRGGRGASHHPRTPLSPAEGWHLRRGRGKGAGLGGGFGGSQGGSPPAHTNDQTNGREPATKNRGNWGQRGARPRAAEKGRPNRNGEGDPADRQQGARTNNTYFQ